MKGTTGQKRGTKQTKNQNPGARTESHGPELRLPQWRLVLFPSLNSFQPKRCTKIWHDKWRENETIPIWNFNRHTCREFWKPVIPFQLNALGKKLGKSISHHSNFSRKTTYLFETERCQVSSCYFELFLGIINTWKNPRIWSPWIFLYRTWQ